MIIADTNLLAYLLIDGPHSSAAEQVFLRDPFWVMPGLWRWEFRNLLSTTVRNGVMTIEIAVGFYARAESIVRESEISAEIGTVLDLSRRSGCSAYDCEFVALALDAQVPLVTADKKILKAFPEAAVSIEDFAV